MPVDLPTPVAGAIERLAAPPDQDVSVPTDVTGALADLWTWWQRLMGDRPVVVARIPAPPGSVEESLARGVELADAAVDAGATLLVPQISEPDPVSARTVIGVLTRREASAILAQPVGMPDEEWMAACATIRDRMAVAADHRGEPLALLAEVDDGRLATVAGVLLGGAARQTACLVDGTAELAAALVADRLAHRAKAWWGAGTTSTDPGRSAAVDRIDLWPGLPLGLSDDAGRGADATIALLDLIR